MAAKSTGIDMEENYVTVTLCIHGGRSVIACSASNLQTYCAKKQAPQFGHGFGRRRLDFRHFQLADFSGNCIRVATLPCKFLKIQK